MSTTISSKNYAHFCENTKDHRLTVEREAGVERRLYVSTPGTGMWSWHVITWPGYLAVVGDIADGYVFSRVTDMLDFFSSGAAIDLEAEPPRIDVRYWAEKLQGPARNSVRIYSAQRFLAWVQSCLDEHHELGTEAIAEIKAELAEAEDPQPVQQQLDDVLARRREVLDEAGEAGENEHEAIDWIYTQSQDLIADPSEAELRDWDVHFIYACWAIALTVKLWHEHLTTHGTRDGFSLVECGLVQNEPGIEVFDLDVLYSNLPDEQVAPEVLNLFGRMAAHPDRRGIQDHLDRVTTWLRRLEDPEINARIEKVLKRRSRIE